MALPRRRQPLAKFIKIHDLTYLKVANALGTNRARVANMVQGMLYPSPHECDVLESLFGLPAQVLFEPPMLAWRYDWPPRVRGGE